MSDDLLQDLLDALLADSPRSMPEVNVRQLGFLLKTAEWALGAGPATAALAAHIRGVRSELHRIPVRGSR